jgi:hypothetical protein
MAVDVIAAQNQYIQRRSLMFKAQSLYCYGLNRISVTYAKSEKLPKLRKYHESFKPDSLKRQATASTINLSTLERRIPSIPLK